MKPVPTDRHRGGPVSVRLRTVMRALAGLFFLSTGLAKLPVVPEVASVVRAVMPAGVSASVLLAVVVIGTEITAGLLLVAGIRVRAAALLGAFTMAVFAAAIGSLLGRGVEIDCHCFGVLGLRLPLGWELGIDLAMGGVLLILRSAFPRADSARDRVRASIVGIAAFLLSGSIAMTTDPAGPFENGGEIIRHAGWGGGRVPRLVLLIDYRELQCALCFDDLIALCDQLREGTPARWERALTIMRSDSVAGVTGEDLRRWAVETGIAGEQWVAEPEEYDGFRSGSNAALILRSDGTTLFRAEFPLGAGRRGELLAMMGEE